MSINGSDNSAQMDCVIPHCAAGRREFLKGAACASGALAIPSLLSADDDSPFQSATNDLYDNLRFPQRRSAARQRELISKWDTATELVSPNEYVRYLRNGGTNGYIALDALERSFEKVMREVKSTVVSGGKPAVWNVYNMGYVVKTRKSLFAIDLVHRREKELAQMVDFALVTHNHNDHWRHAFVWTVAGLGKPVISNFIGCAGYTREKKVFRINDVEIRTSLIDHNRHLIDFTTAFEIRADGFTIYHTGDSGKGTEPKLNTIWGHPDLWLFFPGCGINTPEAVAKVKAKRIVFGHLWELGHEQGHKGRFDERLILPRLAEAKKAGCKDVSVAFWGDRIQ